MAIRSEIASSLPLSDSDSPSPSHHPKNKACTICGVSRPVLVRCQVDESGRWHMICPGKCWRSVSGGSQDARGVKEEFPFYRYGGMCRYQSVACFALAVVPPDAIRLGKNKHAYVSAKKPKHTTHKPAQTQSIDRSDQSDRQPAYRRDCSSPDWRPFTHYTRNDRIVHSGQVWLCRRSHLSRAEHRQRQGFEPGDAPTEDKGHRYWRLDEQFEEIQDEADVVLPAAHNALGADA